MLLETLILVACHGCFINKLFVHFSEYGNNVLVRHFEALQVFVLEAYQPANVAVLFDVRVPLGLPLGLPLTYIKRDCKCGWKH